MLGPEDVSSPTVADVIARRHKRLTVQKQNPIRCLWRTCHIGEASYFATTVHFLKQESSVYTAGTRY